MMGTWGCAQGGDATAESTAARHTPGIEDIDPGVSDQPGADQRTCLLGLFRLGLGLMPSAEETPTVAKRGSVFGETFAAPGGLRAPCPPAVRGATVCGSGAGSVRLRSRDLCFSGVGQ